MTAAKKKPANSAPRKRAVLQPDTPKAPTPPGMAKKAVDTEGRTRDISGGSVPRPQSDIRQGFDPRDDSGIDGAASNEGNTPIEGGGYTDTAGAVHAAPPTPTREHAATANDEPGAGDSTGHGMAPRPRRQLAGDPAVDLAEPTRRHLVLTDAKGEHVYPAGTTKMPREHAEHWYAKAAGVKVPD